MNTNTNPMANVNLQTRLWTLCTLLLVTFIWAKPTEKTPFFTYKSDFTVFKISQTPFVNLGVYAVNDTPIAQDDTAITDEDEPVIIPILDNDTDTEGIDPTSVTIIVAPVHGTVFVNPDGTVRYTPDPNFNGTDTFVYSVCDLGTPVLCDSAIVTITIFPVNDAPVANDDTATTNEDTPVTVSVTANDNDTLDGGSINTLSLDLDPLTPGTQVTFTNAEGTYTADAVGNVTFTPVLNFNGTTTPITYEVCDNGTPLPALCDTATLTITVTAVNDAPVVDDDTATTNEDTPVSGDFTDAGDADPDGTPLTVNTTPVSGPSHGTIVINPDGTYTYTPAPNFNGTDTVNVEICDAGTPAPGICVTEILTITVNAVNDALVANDDTATTNEDTPVTVSVTANDNDTLDGGSINTLSLDLDPSTPGTQVTFTNAEGTYTADAVGNVTFTPVLNFNGTTTPITYEVCDNGTPLPALCDTATLTITVNPVNDSLIAQDDTAFTDEDEPVIIPILENDTAIEGIDTTSVTIVGAPVHGTVFVNPDGTVFYMPDPNYYGIDTFVYSVCDLGTPVLCDTASVTITIFPVNDPPFVNDDNAQTQINTPVTLCVLCNDLDIEELDTVSVTATAPAHGTAVINPDGTITYTPETNFNGTDTFVYTVCDNGIPLPELCDTALVTIQVLDFQIHLDGTYQDFNNDNLVNEGDRILYSFTITNNTANNYNNININLVSGTTVSGNPISIPSGSSNSSLSAFKTITNLDIAASQVKDRAFYSQLTSTDPTPCTVCNIPLGFENYTFTPINRISDDDTNLIKGRIYIDFDLNGCSSLDTIMTAERVRLIDDLGHQLTTYTDTQGKYKFYVGSGNFTVTPDVINNNVSNLSPASFNVSFPENNASVYEQDICVTPINTDNLIVYVYPTVPARPGFTAYYKIRVYNYGNTSVSYTEGILFQFDNTRMNFTGASVPPNFQDVGVLKWNYVNLLPNQYVEIIVSMLINTPTDSVPVQAGDVLHFSATAYPTDIDNSPLNNTFVLNQTVVNSYDPNSMTCLEGQVLPSTEIGEKLHYLVDFENTGNYPASFITVKVPINTTQYNIESLQLIATSHPAYVKVEENDLLVFFDQIMLETNGHGNILFSINSNQNLQEGDTVSENALIFFDFNLPIDTGWANTLYDDTFTTTKEGVHFVAIYPNPTRSFLQIRSLHTIQQLSVFDSQGRLMNKILPLHSQTILDVSQHQNGIYFIEIQTDKGKTTHKVVKQ